MATTKNTTETLHPFERAGLGLAPFRVVGFSVEKYQACQGAPIQCGGSCDYCAQPIMNTYWILSADGRRFKVGCDCVRKTKDARLIAAVRKAENKRRNALKHAKDAGIVAAGQWLLAKPETRAKLAAIPHPRNLTDRATGEPVSWLSYAEWMFDHAGTAGKVKIAKKLAEVAA